MDLYAFRQEVQKGTQVLRDFTPGIDRVLVTTGANLIIYFAISCLINPGKEVIVPDPGFPTCYSAIRYCGAIPVTVLLLELKQFRLNPDDNYLKDTSDHHQFTEQPNRGCYDAKCD